MNIIRIIFSALILVAVSFQVNAVTHSNCTVTSVVSSAGASKYFIANLQCEDVLDLPT